jgi:hypothetical protein
MPLHSVGSGGLCSEHERPGSPIAFSDVPAHVPDALATLSIRHARFLRRFDIGEASPVARRLIGDLVVDRVERYSKPTDVWRKWGPTVAWSRDVTVIHGATCTNVVANDDGTRAVAVEL